MAPDNTSDIVNETIMRVRLLRDLGQFKAGDEIGVSTDDLAELGLKYGADYTPLGTEPQQRPSPMKEAIRTGQLDPKKLQAKDAKSSK